MMPALQRGRSGEKWRRGVIPTRSGAISREAQIRARFRKALVQMLDQYEREVLRHHRRGDETRQATSPRFRLMTHPPGCRANRDASRYAALERPNRSEEHTSEIQSLMRISSAVFCSKKKNNTRPTG